MVVPFKAWHYEWLKTGMNVPSKVLQEMEGQNSWTVVIDGDIRACAGTMQQWAGRHVAWAYMTPGIGRNMGFMTTQTKLKLAEVKGRIEMTVRTDFPAGHRWAKMLGFTVETPLMKAYGPLGEDHTGYVRFN